jgi:hypothetical protein
MESQDQIYGYMLFAFLLPPNPLGSFLASSRMAIYSWLFPSVGICSRAKTTAAEFEPLVDLLAPGRRLFSDIHLRSA